MNIFTKIWKSFKTQPDVWFFFGFLLTCTLSVRKVLKVYPVGGQFNEYIGIYLYLSDIFLILTLITWGYTILCNNKHYLSNIATRFIARIKNVPPQKECSTPVRMFHVEHSTGQAWNILRGRRGTFLLFPLILVIWSFVSLIWADNKIIALFRSFKLVEFYFLYLYVIYNVSRLPRETKLFHVEQFSFFRGGTLLKRSFQFIIALGFVQAIFGIWQFIIQHSIGLFWLKESLISPNIDGVAKIVFHGEKFIRAYGLFPHPNILGGFLLISIVLTLAYDKMFHACPPTVRMEQLDHNRRQIVPRGTIAIIILAIQIIALILTFSKSAIIGLCIVIAYALWRNNKLFHPRRNENVPRGTFSSYGASVEHFWRKVVLIGLILILSLIIAKPNLSSFLTQSLQERLVYLNVSRGTISSNPVLGVGSGQFILEMDKYAPRPPRVDESLRVEAGGTLLEPWQYQPVHNVFLLIWSELGIIGLILFLWLLWKMFQPSRNEIVPRGTISSYGAGVEQSKKCHPELDSGSKVGFWLPQCISFRIESGMTAFRGILLGLIFIMLFDHYLWDIQQGQIMLWVILGLLAGNEKPVK